MSRWRETSIRESKYADIQYIQVTSIRKQTISFFTSCVFFISIREITKTQRNVEQIHSNVMKCRRCCVVFVGSRIEA